VEALVELHIGQPEPCPPWHKKVLKESIGKERRREGDLMRERQDDTKRLNINMSAIGVSLELLFSLRAYYEF
jgi:hypothetical protein